MPQLKFHFHLHLNLKLQTFICHSLYDFSLLNNRPINALFGCRFARNKNKIFPALFAINIHILFAR